MKVLILQHEAFEAPGSLLDWAAARGYTVELCQVYLRHPIPADSLSIDLLIVLGGPQSPNTSKEECPHFDALAEMNLIRSCVEAGKAVLGICLGAQLLAAAMGAGVEHSPEREIGIFPIELTKDGLADNKVQYFGASLLVAHWHGDMPGLSSGVKVLATSPGCPRQILAYSDLVYGFQCHLELTPSVVELLLEADAATLQQYSTCRFVQAPEAIRGFDF
ncbi:MAG: gamma-glutamyl-gamma-aminobutyrate hydrolase family protein, partial [Bacteroidetes bacterium]|nr:gamma-glutamyl-gamma-aminobutyrate hydrolase family protein [Bacteroidota bacterium]